MRKLAEKLGLACVVDNFCHCNWLAKLLRRYKASGVLRGRDINIYIQRSTTKPQISVRTVMHMPIELLLNSSLVISPKRMQSLLKIFGKDLRAVPDYVLNKYIMGECADDILFNKIFLYEEIINQCYNVWGSKYNYGVLIVNSNGIYYFEPNGFMYPEKRERFCYAANLLCDIADVLTMPEILSVAEQSDQIHS